MAKKKTKTMKEGNVKEKKQHLAWNRIGIEKWNRMKW